MLLFSNTNTLESFVPWTENRSEFINRRLQYCNELIFGILPWGKKSKRNFYVYTMVSNNEQQKNQITL